MTTQTAIVAAPVWREQLLALFAWLQRFPLALFQLAFRICIGGVFWHSGMTKIASWDTTLALFRDEYRVPVIPIEWAATMATSVELVTPVLLLVGFASRLATLPMLGMTFVIQTFVYPEDWNEHLFWASVLLFILTRGPGVLSLDHLIARRSLSSQKT